MSRPKKQPKDMTTEEIARKVFPPKVLRELKKLAHANDDKTASSQR